MGNGNGQSQALTVTGLNKYLSERSDMIAEWCQGTGMDPTTLRRVAVRDLANPDKGKRLSACTQESIYLALTHAAQLGLDPSGIGGEGYLVPYKGLCVFQPGYRGLVKLALESGLVKNVWAEAAHSNDHFKVHVGTDPRIEHEPNYDDPGEFVAVYAVARFADGNTQFTVLSKSQVDQIREASMAKNGPAWSGFYLEMAKKSAVKRLSKMLPMGRRMRMAMDFDSASEIGDRNRMSAALERDDFIDVTPESAQETNRGTSDVKAAIKKKNGKKSKAKDQAQLPISHPDAEPPPDDDVPEFDVNPPPPEPPEGEAF